MKRLCYMPALVLALSTVAVIAVADTIQNPKIEFDRFLDLGRDVEAVRKSRRVSEAKFLEMSRASGTIILDTRSKRDFDYKHIAGAINLNFSEITEESLARVVGDKDTRILIYCSNNFKNDNEAFASKASLAALNIPTFITLAAYGYKNVYELGPLIDVNNTKVIFEGTSVRQGL